jgi:serpin B
MQRTRALAALLAIAACGQPQKTDTPKADKPKAEEPKADPTTPEKPPTEEPKGQDPAGPDAKSPDAEALARGNGAFAFALYSKLKAKEGNLFFSPYNISTALAMTYAGARGDTAAEMKKTLSFTLPDDKLHPAFGTLQAAYNAKGKRYELRVANRLWGDKSTAFVDDYVKLTREVYGAPLESLDFTKGEEARKAINAWVEEQTSGKIKDLIKKLGADTKLVLTSAIYFKGNWASQFKKENTKEEPFQPTASKKAAKAITVPMMHQTLKAKYAAADGVQALELPYVGDELAMVILLPDAIDGLAELEKKLTPENLEKWLSALSEEEVAVALPKFTMTYKANLAELLGKMGMPKAFTGDADFSGMTKGEKLWISAVIHQAFVDVNEEGTEAAAATAVTMVKGMAAPPKAFTADHPFVFLIRDVKTGGVLFLGRVANP